MLQRAVGKNLPAKAGEARDPGSIPGSGRSPGEGNGNPLQYSCLENSMDRGAWQATVHGIAKSRTQLSTMRARAHTGWMDLEDIMLSEISWSQKDESCMSSFTRGT